ncbi:MAG: aminotransferase class III-fold pyridoxal phosphate-dependent enzyme, partial [Eubacteriales bacterium]
GTLLAQEQYGVKGDITTLAKGLGGGLPIGAILLSETTENVFKFSDHGTTYGGNPIVCAGAITVLEQLDLDKVNQTATYFREKLAKMDGVESVSGLGMMIGISLSSKEAPAVIEACLAKGLIILSAKTKLRFLPPLNISKEEIDIGLKILEEVLSDTAENDN